MHSCALILVAALLASRADPPPPDTCCLTYGQVQQLLANTDVIEATTVSQCLESSATNPSTLDPKLRFKFIADQTVGLSPKEGARLEICLQWKAIQQVLVKRPGSIQLVRDGVLFAGKEVEKFRSELKKTDVVILVMRFAPQKKTCELDQIHIVSIDKVKGRK
jgi:hypothetical protein